MQEAGEAGETAVWHTWQHLPWHPPAHSDEQFSLRGPAPSPGTAAPALPSRGSSALNLHPPALGLPSARAVSTAPWGPGVTRGSRSLSRTPVLAAEPAHSPGSARPGCSGPGCGRALPALPAAGKGCSCRGILGCGTRGSRRTSALRPHVQLWEQKRGGQTAWGAAGRAARPEAQLSAAGHAVMLPATAGETAWMPVGNCASLLRGAAKEGLALC